MSHATEAQHDDSPYDSLSKGNDLASTEILKNWLPKLSQYQSLLAAAPHHDSDRIALSLKQNTRDANSNKVAESSNGVIFESTLSEAAPSPLVAESRSIASVSDASIREPKSRRNASFGRGACRSFPIRWRVIREPSKPTLVHLPIDGVLTFIQKRKPCMLGLGCCGGMDQVLKTTLANELAARLSDKLDRKTLLVHVLDSGSDEVAKPLASEGKLKVSHLMWHSFEESKQGKATWNNQLARLVIQKRDYELIVFDLGDASSDTMLRMGRLCDGVLIQFSSKKETRQTIETLKSLKNNQLPILGAWSI
jgi:hypothetical protein